MFPQESPRRCRAAARRRFEILARVRNPAAKATSNRNATPIRSMIRVAQSVATRGRLVGNHRIFDRDGASAGFPANLGIQPIVDCCRFVLLNRLQFQLSVKTFA
jgi:hypothetical protein